MIVNHQDIYMNVMTKDDMWLWIEKISEDEQEECREKRKISNRIGRPMLREDNPVNKSIDSGNGFR